MGRGKNHAKIKMKKKKTVPVGRIGLPDRQPQNAQTQKGTRNPYNVSVCR
jgi:hypothetical protein